MLAHGGLDVAALAHVMNLVALVDQQQETALKAAQLGKSV